MARATTKEDLLQMAEERYNQLWKLIDSMTEEEQRREFIFDLELAGKEEHWKRDKNIRDVLIHLYEWHNLLLNWINSNLNGERKPFLPEPYNWKTYGTMNVEMIWKKHQSTSYESAKEMVQNSHKKVMKLIESMSNEELFSKGSYSWVGGSTVGQYCISVTSSHYDWAMKKIKKQKQAINKEV